MSPQGSTDEEPHDFGHRRWGLGRSRRSTDSEGSEGRGEQEERRRRGNEEGRKRKEESDEVAYYRTREDDEDWVVLDIKVVKTKAVKPTPEIMIPKPGRYRFGER